MFRVRHNGGRYLFKFQDREAVIKARPDAENLLIEAWNRELMSCVRDSHIEMVLAIQKPRRRPSSSTIEPTVGRGTERIAESANGRAPVKKQTAGELRLHKDISELNLPKSCSILFPNGKDDLMNFEVAIRPDEGYYLGGTFNFSFQVNSIYPHEASKVKCKTKVYHPNIDLEGNVCLNIL
ncbi:hypothetical protein AAG906_038709 [Vitis piasezkii]